MQASFERPRCRRFIAAASGLLAACLPAAAQAHEKWFLDSRPYPLRWDLFVSQGGLLCAVVVALLTACLGFLWFARGARDFIPPPERFGTTARGRLVIYAMLPLIIGLHAAIPLFVSGSHGVLFAPNVELTGAAVYATGLVQIGIGLALFYGGLTRLAALGLFALWLAGLGLAGVESMLENALYLGIAGFFFFAGRGPIAIDRYMFPKLEPPEALARFAVPSLRIGIGISFAVVAFTEKLANLPFAIAFLHKFPLNFAAALGMPVSDQTFVLAAGSIELLIGLCLIFGVFVREVIIIAWLPFNLTLTYFNSTELIGHLPIYGIMALLLIWIPGKQNDEQWTSGLHLFRDPPDSNLPDLSSASSSRSGL